MIPLAAQEVEASAYPMAKYGERDGKPFFGRLSCGTKVLFSAPLLGFMAAKFMKVLYMKKFYTDDYPLASLSVIACFSAITAVLDIFWEPFLATWTDNTRLCCGKDRGRRRPFIFVSGILLCFISICGFAPPASLSSSAQEAWQELSSTASEEKWTQDKMEDALKANSGDYTSVSSAVWWGIFNIGFHTLADSTRSISSEALGAELTPDFTERTSVWANYEVFSIVGILLGLITPAVVSIGPNCDASPNTGCDLYLYIAIIISVVFIIPNCILCCYIKERPASSLNKEPANLVPSVIQAFLNRPFGMLIISDMIEGVGGNLPMAVLPYVTEWLLMDSSLLAPLIITHFLVRIPATFVWKCAVDKFGKLSVYLFFNFIFGVSHLLFLFIGEGHISITFVLVAFWGMAYGGHWILRDIVSDVLDYDEFLTGQRREGQFMMVLDLIPKLMEVPCEALPFLLMAYFGYNPRLEEQSPGVTWTIRLSFSVVPGLFGLLSTYVIYQFPLKSKQQHESILLGIEKHKAGQSFIDPLTGIIVPPTQQLQDTVLFGSNEIDEEYFQTLQYFFPSEIRDALEEEDVSSLRRKPIFGIICAIILIFPGIWIFWAGFDKLAAGEHSWSPIGLILLGVSITILFFSIARLRKALEAVSSEMPVEALEVMQNIYLSQGVLSLDDTGFCSEELSSDEEEY